MGFQKLNMNIFAITGAATIGFIRSIGAFGMFFAEICATLFSKPYLHWKSFGKQLIEIGYYSLPVVGLTSIFTGAVLALQSYTGFSRFNAENAIAAVVVLSIVRELGPVLTGLMLSGRVAAAIAAEVGSMKVTEQLDALYALGANPMRYLVLPRILAGVVAMPCLVLIADIIGVLGGYLVAVHNLGFSPGRYLNSMVKFVVVSDVVSGLIKAFYFGLIITFIGCFFGLNAKGGAHGVGHATTSAVVLSSILILLANYMITGFLFSV